MAGLDFSGEQLAAMDKGCGKAICHAFDPKTQTMTLVRGERKARVRFNGKGVRMIIPGQNRGLWGPYRQLAPRAALRYVRRALMAAAA